jgi:C-terminal processing protease CtpA/Prc
LWPPSSQAGKFLVKEIVSGRGADKSGGIKIGDEVTAVGDRDVKVPCHGASHSMLTNWS